MLAAFVRAEGIRTAIGLIQNLEMDKHIMTETVIVRIMRRRPLTIKMVFGRPCFQYYTQSGFLSSAS